MRVELIKKNGSTWTGTQTTEPSQPCTQRRIITHTARTREFSAPFCALFLRAKARSAQTQRKSSACRIIPPGTRVEDPGRIQPWPTWKIKPYKNKAVDGPPPGVAITRCYSLRYSMGRHTVRTRRKADTLFTRPLPCRGKKQVGTNSTLLISASHCPASPSRLPRAASSASSCRPSSALASAAPSHSRPPRCPRPPPQRRAPQLSGAARPVSPTQIPPPWTSAPQPPRLRLHLRLHLPRSAARAAARRGGVVPLAVAVLARGASTTSERGRTPRDGSVAASNPPPAGARIGTTHWHAHAHAHAHTTTGTHTHARPAGARTRRRAPRWSGRGAARRASGCAA